MQQSLIGPNACPPIPPAHNVRPVYIKAVPATSSLRYMFDIVMAGERGAIGWDPMGDNLILYLLVEEIDHLHFPTLDVGAEVWACFRVRDNL